MTFISRGKATNEVFPDAAARPREVFAYAWHDQFAHQRATVADPKDYRAAFENVRKELQAQDPVVCDFVWKGLPFVVMSEFTGYPGFPTWEEYEKTVASVCAANPGKPVFVVDIETDQQDGDWHAWGITLRGGGCGNLAHIQTPVGKPGVLTYVMPFTLPDGKEFTGNCELSFFFRPEIKGNRFAVRRLRLLTPN